MSVPRVAVVYPLPMAYTFPVLRLVAASGEVELVVLYARGSLAARGRAPDPDGLGFPHEILADAGVVHVGREVRELDLSPGLPRALDRFRPDLVVVSGYVQPTALTGVAWARLRSRPYGLLVESHDLRRRGPVRGVLRRALVSPVVRGASVLFPTGEAAAASLAALGARPGREARLPHVPDPELFHDRGRAGARAAVGERLGLAPGVPLLAFVGRLVESKGVRTLVEAQREIHRRGGARLAVAGDGPLRRELEAPGATFLGHVPPGEVAELLRAADVAVSASLDEPWGTFPLEAAASGCAVVATDRVPSAVELATRHGAAELVPAGDAGALAVAVLELLDAPDRLAELARRAAAAAAAYTPEAAAASFLCGVRLALAGGRP